MKFFTPIARVSENKTVRVIAKRRQNLLKRSIQEQTFINKPNYYGILYQNEQNEWRVGDKQGVEQIPCGIYTFIRTTTGFIRVSPAPQGTTNHLDVANHAAEVRYAGEIAFNMQGQMLSWNNKSGGYQPDFHQASQAGLPLHIFCPVYDAANSSNLQDIQAPLKKRKSDLGFIASPLSQSNEDDHFAQLRAKKRHAMSAMPLQNREISQGAVKCTA